MLTNLLCIAGCVKQIHPNIPRNANIASQFLLFCDFIPLCQAEYSEVLTAVIHYPPANRI